MFSASVAKWEKNVGESFEPLRLWQTAGGWDSVKRCHGVSGGQSALQTVSDTLNKAEKPGEGRGLPPRASGPLGANQSSRLQMRADNRKRVTVSFPLCHYLASCLRQPNSERMLPQKGHFPLFLKIDVRSLTFPRFGFKVEKDFRRK